MHDELHTRALMPVAPPDRNAQIDRIADDPLHTRTPLPKRTAADVLGYTPQNRRDRRKAAKLLRKKG